MVHKSVLIGAIALIVSGGAFTAPSAEAQRRPGRVLISYEPGATARDKRARSLLQDTKTIEMITEPIGRMFYLPKDLRIVTRSCGQESSHYDPVENQVVMCYELFHEIEYNFHSMMRPGNDFNVRVEVVIRTYHLFSFMLLRHATAALIDILNLPITGREDDAIDQFAAMCLLFMKDGGVKIVSSIAMYFGELARQDLGQGLHVSEMNWEEEAFNAQRLYNVLCIMYGSNPRAFAELVGPDGLPRERALRCPVEFQKIEDGWSKLLDPHIHESFRRYAQGLERR